MAQFHPKVGQLVTLNNDRKTAQRSHPSQEFNNGVVLSAEALRDNQLFEVKIDRKVNSWSGSIEIGVTTADPENTALPTSATGFREGTWVMSGSNILKDGHTVVEEYGKDLDQLNEGDKIGVMRNNQGSLHFYVNGRDQGQAAANIPSKVYAVIDMYGKCAQVTIVDDSTRDIIISNEITNEAIAEASYIHSNETLVFHERVGSLVKLSNNRRTAERRRPLDEFNNGVVMTNRPIRDDEIFEIRLDRLVDKWSGSIEVGITTHNPSNLDFPATMTNMRSGSSIGTIMMSGCGILTNGKGTRREYGQFNLDELSEGDRIGMIRKSSGALHFFINGVDQGVAATRTPQLVWGVIDLYGMAVKVTILNRNDARVPPLSVPERLDRRVNNLLRQMQDFRELEEENDCSAESVETEKLQFHSKCGTHAVVINGQRTASRPNAKDEFNNGVVMTNRPLKPGELFEVRIDKMVDKWAGSVELGMTTHSPLNLEFPSTMTNIRSGTWMLTGNGVMHNGTTILDEYCPKLDKIKVGDILAALRKDNGDLHFMLNGVDQGLAASSLPPNVYGVLDLYGQVAQATLVDQDEDVRDGDRMRPVGEDDLLFHSLHGHNAEIVNRGKTAVRPNAYGEFNDAIVMSNRPLRDNELFEVRIDKMVDRWSGSIEVGLSLVKPEDLDFPSTMTDIDFDTWMLSGSAVMQDGSTIRNGYTVDLDGLTTGSRIGMMRKDDASLHFFVDGQEHGVACSDIPAGMFAVIDLYGQCAQVTITQGSGVQTENNLVKEEVNSLYSNSCTVATEVSHKFSQCCGKNITLKNNNCVATRGRNFNHGILFSCDPLRSDEIFEVHIDECVKQWSGSLMVGLTTMVLTDSTNSLLPASASGLQTKSTWLVSGSTVKKNGVVLKENYAPSLERLERGNRVGIRWSNDGCMHVLINGEDMGVAATNVPKNTFAVIDLYGSVETVSVCSKTLRREVERHPSSHALLSTHPSLDDGDKDEDVAESQKLSFASNHGKNIELTGHGITAHRTDSYNQGIVLTHKPLPRKHLFQVTIEKLATNWTDSIMIGVLGYSPERLPLPTSALNLKKHAWVIHNSAVFHAGVKVKENYGPGLSNLSVGHKVGVQIEPDNTLHLYVNGVDQGIAAIDIPHKCYAIVDLYGKCKQVTVVDDSSRLESQHSDQKEKVFIEDGMKEKLWQKLEPACVKNCDYKNLCTRLKQSLGLPDEYFIADQAICYCDTCHKIRHDDPYMKIGDPPKEFATPYGWCKFTLKLRPKAQSLNVQEKWHLAYHGTHIDKVRRILDSGELIMPGLSEPESFSLLSTSGSRKPEECDVSPICLSPSVRYGCSSTFAPQYEHRDICTRKSYCATLAFQAYIKPGSYKTGPQTLGLHQQIDPRFTNNEVEWSTKEEGAIALHALLVKLE
ncbi:unnamed protein product [Owenia fusiformis]|uniref:Uncharacterized protein n=1 Tax=Owenia fusiformis TaxID=6347 RepID=A0A8J1U9G7_OWEFU|nr:unnamed protein product [Owenia fusiformis]